MKIREKKGQTLMRIRDRKGQMLMKSKQKGRDFNENQRENETR